MPPRACPAASTTNFGCRHKSKHRFQLGLPVPPSSPTHGHPAAHSSSPHICCHLLIPPHVDGTLTQYGIHFRGGKHTGVRHDPPAPLPISCMTPTWPSTRSCRISRPRNPLQKRKVAEVGRSTFGEVPEGKGPAVLPIRRSCKAGAYPDPTAKLFLTHRAAPFSLVRTSSRLLSYAVCSSLLALGLSSLPLDPSIPVRVGYHTPGT